MKNDWWDTRLLLWGRQSATISNFRKQSKQHFKNINSKKKLRLRAVFHTCSHYYISMKRIIIYCALLVWATFDCSHNENFFKIHIHIHIYIYMLHLFYFHLLMACTYPYTTHGLHDFGASIWTWNLLPADKLQ